MPLVAGKILQQSLVQFFNRHWCSSSTVTGTIVQQPLAPLFNSRWQDCLTATGMIVQHSLARLFNSYWYNPSAVPGKIFFLCWQNSSTMMFTVEESCHVSGIRHMIHLCLCPYKTKTMKWRIISFIKDTLKAFDDLKNKQQKFIK